MIFKNHKIAMEKLTQYLIEKNMSEIKAEELNESKEILSSIYDYTAR